MIRWLRLLLPTLAAAAALVLTSCDANLPPEKLVEQAQKEYQEGNRSAALVSLKNALEKDRDNAEGRFLLGRIGNDLQDGAGAEQALRRVQELKLIKGGWTLAELGRALLLQEKYKEMLELLKPATGFEEGATAAILALRGRAYIGLRDAKEAAKALEEARKVQPENPHVLLLEARFKAAARDLAGATAVLDRVLAKQPGHIDALMDKADLQLLRNDMDGAVKTYTALIAAAPSFLPGWAGRATILIRTGKLAEAQKDVDRLRKGASRSPATMYLQGLIYFRSGKYREAQAAVQDSLKFDAEYPLARLLSAGVHIALASYVQAETELTQYLAKYPREITGRKLMALTMLEIDDGPRALEALQPVLGRTNDAMVLALAGDAELKSGHYDQAIEYLQQAVKANPQKLEYRTTLAMSRLGAGDIEQGIADLEAARKLGGGDGRAETLLALTNLRNKRYDDALAVLKDLMAKRPKDPQAYNIAGAVYMAKKDTAAARRSFEKALELKPLFFPAAVNLSTLDMQDKNPAAARKRFENILAQDKNHVSSMVMLADLAASQGKNQEGLDWLERARRASPTALDPRVRLSRIYLANGQTQMANEIATEALTSNPENATALENLGTVQFGAGDVNSALNTYLRLVKIAPGSPKAQYLLALTQVRVGRPKEAETSLRKAVELNPRYVEAKAALASLLLDMNRLDDAGSLAREISKSYPKASTGYSLEGDVYASQRKYPDALKAYETAFKVQPSGPLAIKVYKARVRSGNAQGGEAALVDWIKVHPDDLSVRMYYGDALQQTARYKQAAEQYEYVVAKSRDTLLALNNLATVYHEMKDPRALDTAERAYKMKPENPVVADTLGWILVEQNKTQRGLDILAKASSQAPEQAEIRYHWAVALAKSGDKATARRELERLLASKKPFKQMKEAKTLLGQL